MAAELNQQLSDEDEPLLMIEIEDTGIGISPEVMGKLFTPFRQAQRMAGLQAYNNPRFHRFDVFMLLCRGNRTGSLFIS